MNAWAAWPLAARAEPALNPNQPNQRMPVPIITSGIECGGSALVRPALALAEHEHGGQGGDAGVDVDGRAAGEVERAALAEPAAVHPLEDRDVDEEQPQRHEERPRRELHPVGDGPRDERRGDHGEHPEEGDDRQLPAVAGDGDVLEEERVEGAEEVVVERALGQRVPEHHPQDGMISRQQKFIISMLRTLRRGPCLRRRRRDPGS